MPVIPNFDVNVGVSSGGPTPRADPTAFAAPGAALAQEGAQISAEADQFAQRYVDAKRQADAANIVAQGVQQLGDARFKWSKLDDHQAAYDGYQQDASTIKSNLLKNVSDPLVASYVSRSLDPEIVNGALSTRDASFRVESSAQRGNLDNNLLTYRNAIAAAPNPEATAHYQDLATQAIQGARAAGWIAPEEADQRHIQFNSDVATDQVKRRGLIDPAGTAAILSDPVKQQQMFPGLSPNAADNLAKMYDYRADRIERNAQSAQNHADFMAEKQLRVTQSGNTASLVSNALDPTKPQLGAGDLADMVRNQQISESGMQAVLSAQIHANEGHDEPMVVLNLQKKMNDGDLAPDDITQALAGHHVSGRTGLELMRAIGSQQRIDQNQSRSAAMSQIDTAFSAGAISAGLFGKDTADQSALLANAKMQLIARINNGEDPQAVSSDLITRLAPTLPQPSQGVFTPGKSTIADVQSVAAKTKTAHDAGLISDDQFGRDVALLKAWNTRVQQVIPPQPASKKGTP